MKQLFTVLILITVLISFGGVNSYALDKFFIAGDLDRPDPDDHPWGGEDQYNPSVTTRTIAEPIQIKTGFMIIDVFTKFLFEVIYQDLNSNASGKSTTSITTIYSTETGSNQSTYQESYTKGK